MGLVISRVRDEREKYGAKRGQVTRRYFTISNNPFDKPNFYPTSRRDGLVTAEWTQLTEAWTIYVNKRGGEQLPIAGMRDVTGKTKLREVKKKALEIAQRYA